MNDQGNDKRGHMNIYELSEQRPIYEGSAIDLPRSSFLDTHPRSVLSDPHNVGLLNAGSYGSEPLVWPAAAWQALVRRIVAMTHDGGETRLNFDSTWSGSTRWARNRVSVSGDRTNNTLTIGRSIHSDGQYFTLNALDDASLHTALTYLEQAIALYRRQHLQDFAEPPFNSRDYLHPTLWFDSTLALDGARRAAAAQVAIAPAERAGMVAAGFLEATATGVAVNRPALMMDLYYPTTEAQYSVTVRDPQGTGSGWAGVNWNDWARIDVEKLSAIALDKCLCSRNPVAVEPGRYTTILEPQAVYDFVHVIVHYLDWLSSMQVGFLPYHDASVAIQTKLGQQLLDPRLTIRADPMDPDLGFVPFDSNGEPYRPAVWFDKGVLTHLAYNRRFAVQQGLGDLGLLNSGCFRLDGSGPTTTIDEMIATTKRGVLVTRFDQVHVLDFRSLLQSGYTRDGLWLIENGKISKPIKNFRFTESPLFALNQVEQIGVAQRVFCPGSAALVPPLKVRDFSFSALSDAV
jgi:predicted Zn-dependent protease